MSQGSSENALLLNSESKIIKVFLVKSILSKKFGFKSLMAALRMKLNAEFYTHN